MCYVSPVWSTGEKTVYIKTHKTAINRPVDHVTHTLSKGRLFFIEILSFSLVTETIFFPQINPYISNVAQQCRLSPMLGLPVVSREL